jgi:hypothetical protein
VRAKHQDQVIFVASVGTNAEIQQLGYCSDGSVNVVTKALCSGPNHERGHLDANSKGCIWLTGLCS